jgi:hypothetical protein
MAQDNEIQAQAAVFLQEDFGHYQMRAEALNSAIELYNEECQIARGYRQEYLEEMRAIYPVIAENLAYRDAQEYLETAEAED